MTFSRLLVLIILTAAASGCGKKPGPTLAGGKPIDMWLHAVSDRDAKVRKQAVEKLGNVGSSDPAVYSALSGALQDTSAEIRCEAILALLKLGPVAKASVETLKALAQKDSEPRVRDYAAKAVAKLEQ